MLTELEAGIGLDVVIWLQAHGNKVFDALAKGLHLAGRVPTYIALLAVTYWGVDKRLARRYFLGMLLLVILVVALKAVLQAPRPFQAFPDLVMALVEQDGFGLPSGHVAFAVFGWGYLILWLWRRRRRGYWLLAMWAVYVALQFWARMYLGVHYPQDVVAGLLLGGGMLFLYRRYLDALTLRFRRTVLRKAPAGNPSN